MEQAIKFASTKEGEKLMEEVKEYKLSKEILQLIQEYENIGGERDIFLWKWLRYLTGSRDPGFMFSTVPKEYTSSVADVKTTLILFIALIDDLADKYKNKQLLKEEMKIPFNKSEISFGYIKNEKELNLLKFTMSVWDYVESTLKTYPNYQEFRDIFEFDVKQMLNSVYHSCIVNTNLSSINLMEANIYGGHNMAIFLCADIDFMASPTFDKSELPWMREIIWNAQQMARIGNWISTWERELWENDFSSGMFAYSIINDIITINELSSKDETKKMEVIKKIKNSNVESYFLKEWKKDYEAITNLKSKVNSLDVDSYLKGLEQILKFHLASRGLK